MNNLWLKGCILYNDGHISINRFETKSRAVSTALNQTFTALVYGHLQPWFMAIYGSVRDFWATISRLIFAS